MATPHTAMLLRSLFAWDHPSHDWLIVSCSRPLMQYIKMFFAKRHIDSCWWLPWIRDLGEYIAQSVTSPICCRAQRGSTLFLPWTGFRRRDVHSRDGSWPNKRRPQHMRVVAHIVVREEIPDVRGNLHSGDSFGMCYLCVNSEFLGDSK